MPCLSSAKSGAVDLSQVNVTTVKTDLPLFVQNDVFTDFRFENYTWNYGRKAILVLRRKVGQPNQSQNYVESKPIAKVKEENADYMGGCPLECPFDPNENFEEALNEKLNFESTFPGLSFDKSQYEIVSERDARKVINYLMFAHYQKKSVNLEGLDLSLPIYVPCEATIPISQVVMFGFQGGHAVQMRMFGPLQRESPELNMKFLLSLHQKINNNTFPSPIHRQVHVVYEKTHGEFKALGKVFMEFMWNDPKSIFEAPPVSNARVKIVVQPCLGDANPFLMKMWEEMKILDTTVAMIDNNEIMELERSHFTILGTSGSDEKGEVVQRMLQLLNQPSVPNWKKGTEYSDSLETVLKRVVDVDRSDSDFTDQVWLILKESTSLQELFECVHAMFTSIESKAYRPYLLPSNKTLLGRLLQQMVNNEVVNFRTILTVRKAVEITLDCGLNKIFKDYSFVLGMCHLAEPDETKEFSPQEDNFNISLTNLKKLHCILEVLCLTRERIALSMSELEMQTRKLLKHFCNHELEEKKTFHFDVPLSSVAPAVIGLHPVYWKLRTESSTLSTTTWNSMVISRDIFLDYTKKLFTASDGTVNRGYFLYVYRDTIRITE